MANKKLMLAIGISGWALLSVLGKSRVRTRQDRKIAQKKELHTWEGEGGNLPSSASAPNALGDVATGNKFIN